MFFDVPMELRIRKESNAFGYPMFGRICKDSANECKRELAPIMPSAAKFYSNSAERVFSHKTVQLFVRSANITDGAISCLPVRIWLTASTEHS